MPHISEYEVEDKFIERLESIGYEYISLKNYDDVIGNFRTQLIKFNQSKLIEAKGSAELSDSEFNRVLIHMDNKSVYESAKIDGANAWQQYTKITLPYTLFVTGPYLLTSFTGNMNNFNVIYLLTGGAPKTDYNMSTL